jgi:5-oxoprolinase (ATP-hydrolysing)
VVGGNTEVSQRIVDTVLKSFGLAACSQGTMNNLLFGTESFGYYETICGGAGASRNAPGAHAVHTHMTNTRITDVEILEKRYPVRVERFGIRPGSGGAGLHCGGDGVTREFAFLAPVSLSLLTQHRVRGPFGLEGGEPGLPGRQEMICVGGTVVELASIDSCDALPGDRLIMETPGGGGWGQLNPD